MNSDMVSNFNDPHISEFKRQKRWSNTTAYVQTKLWFPKVRREVSPFFKCLLRTELGKAIQFLTRHNKLGRHQAKVQALEQGGRLWAVWGGGRRCCPPMGTLPGCGSHGMDSNYRARRGKSYLASTFFFCQIFS